VAPCTADTELLEAASFDRCRGKAAHWRQVGYVENNCQLHLNINGKFLSPKFTNEILHNEGNLKF
jgi:hypothetical protein